MDVVLPLEKPSRLVERVRQARRGEHDDVLSARCLRRGEQRQRNRDDGGAKFGDDTHRLFSGPYQGRHRPLQLPVGSSPRGRPSCFVNLSPAFAGNLQALTFLAAGSRSGKSRWKPDERLIKTFTYLNPLRFKYRKPNFSIFARQCQLHNVRIQMTLPFCIPGICREVPLV